MVGLRGRYKKSLNVRASTEPALPAAAAAVVVVVVVVHAVAQGNFLSASSS